MGLIIDTFSGVSFGTTDTGETWTLQQTPPYDSDGVPAAQEPSVFSVSGGGARGDNGNLISVATIDSGTADGELEADVEFPLPNAQGVGLVARYADSSNFWYAVAYNHPGGPPEYRLFLARALAGVEDVPLVTGFSQAAGIATLRFTMDGDLLEASISGATLTLTSTFNQTAPLHGIHSYGLTTPAIYPIREYRAPTALGGWSIGRIGF